MNSPEKISPLKDPPLRLPGQSLDEKIQRMDESITEWLAYPACLIAFAAYEWFGYLTKSPRQPWIITLLAVGISIYLVLRVLKLRKRRRCYQQGRDGERFVAEILNPLQAKGYRVLHDVVVPDKCNIGNIDHILIGPSGIFAIETKTLSQRAKQPNAIWVSEGQVYSNGRPIRPNPIEQAKRNAAWINARLKQHIHQNRWVTPVVVFPGWDVKLQTPPNGLYVLNPKQIKDVLSSGVCVLNEPEIAEAAGHFEDFIRTQQKDSQVRA
jgi:hypothetical protein